MVSTNSLGLPDFVYRLLLSKSEDVHSKLDFNINGTGDNIEITLRWRKWGSRWEDPFDCRATKYKSFSNRKRDSNRRKMFNVERNSKSVSTDNIDNESQTGFDMCDMDLTTPISAPKKTVQAISDTEKHSVHRNGHMVRGTTQAGWQISGMTVPSGRLATCQLAANFFRRLAALPAEK